MSQGLYGIDSESRGLRGFVGNLGRELEDELVDKFDGRVEKYNIDVRYNENHSSDFFELIWYYKGIQDVFSGEFSLKKVHDSSGLIIDRFPRVGIYNIFNYAYSNPSLTELRIATEMEEAVKGFLDERFGESNFTRGNGCPIYRTDLPEKFIIEAA